MRVVLICCKRPGPPIASSARFTHCRADMPVQPGVSSWGEAAGGDADCARIAEGNKNTTASAAAQTIGNIFDMQSSR